MLIINVPDTESWDETTNRFVYIKGTSIELMHSLVSLSKWESRFEKPFLSSETKTRDETYGYIQEMCSTELSHELIDNFSAENMADINKFIEAKNSATWFKEPPGRSKNREIITAEIIYYWMFYLQIPKETENWHLTRLFTLIKVINEKNQPAKKMSKAEQLAQQRTLNAQRLREMNTAG